MSSSTNAFRPIGEMAQAADAMPDGDSDDNIDNDNSDSQQQHYGTEDHPVEVIESLCMQCGENGQTRLLLTLIPFFKEVIIMSFRCPECGFHNNEIQSAGQIHELGSTYTVKATIREDLDRQLVKSEFATLSIPEYELTLPPGKGQLTTIESVLSATIADLELDQPLRKHTDPPTYEKIASLLERLRTVVPDDSQSLDQSLALEKTFTVKLDDPTGNSFVEARGGLSDPKWSKKEYRRTTAQNEAIGMANSGQSAAQNDGSSSAAAHKEMSREAAIAAATAALHSRKAPPSSSSSTQQRSVDTNRRNVGLAPTVSLTDDYISENPEEVYSFPDVCSSCGATLETYMKSVDIPHFKEVMLMSTNCHSCGYRDNEIKSGGAISAKGRKVTLKVEDVEDLSRDVLKSETAALTIPEIELHLQPGTLGGRFTTLEGLLNQVYEELDEKVFARGDAAAKGEGSEMDVFLIKLKQTMQVDTPFTVILDDPLANSYIQNPYAPDQDPNMVEEEYERDFEQNEDLGLNDVQVEGYEGEAEAKAAREEEDRIAAQ